MLFRRTIPIGFFAVSKKKMRRPLGMSTRAAPITCSWLGYSVDCDRVVALLLSLVQPATYDQVPSSQAGAGQFLAVVEAHFWERRKLTKCCADHTQQIPRSTTVICCQPQNTNVRLETATALLAWACSMHWHGKGLWLVGCVTRAQTKSYPQR